jgi:hypothetical protein
MSQVIDGAHVLDVGPSTPKASEHDEGKTK